MISLSLLIMLVLCWLTQLLDHHFRIRTRWANLCVLNMSRFSDCLKESGESISGKLWPNFWSYTLGVALHLDVKQYRIYNSQQSANFWKGPPLLIYTHRWYRHFTVLLVLFLFQFSIRSFSASLSFAKLTVKARKTKLFTEGSWVYRVIWYTIQNK